ncbi:SRPBCC family protein [Herbidospora sp. NBRC 101105]|uniref:SRPBCC family protein n=1 Tax=Herbidospora sp. NBRC 101105 TaxID=3032195 RepID=UPI0024A47AA9|nr:SRPBCC family protein [Herbidospora sp. NBRC 101105]GLX99149.1 hypothetical protein Hesp01_70990 [Herbidospora sp. NBRC 101105]
MKTRCHLTGSFEVALPPEEAFHLFTPAGERAWVDGWDPVFPDPMGEQDDTLPGTVFQTHADGDATTWVVLERRRGQMMSYARLTPGHRAGTVTVTLAPASAQITEVTVTYDLTALTEPAQAELEAFAEGYSAFMRSWHDTIAKHLSSQSH